MAELSEQSEQSRVSTLPERSGLSYGYQPSPADEARGRTRDHVQAIARLIDGEDVAITRTTAYGSTIADVEALSGLEAAVHVRDGAAGLVREYAIAARGEGACWATVGAALGLGELVDRTGEDLGEAAFLFVTEGRTPEAGPGLNGGWSGWRSSVGWTCATCGGRVSDHGPFDRHPDDAEPGHATDCGRRHRALAKARAAWDHGELPDQDTDEQGPGDEDVDDEDPATGGGSGRW